MDERPVSAADEQEALGESTPEPGPAGNWGGGASPVGPEGGHATEGGHGGEGGYGGGSTGFDESPEQGLADPDQTPNEASTGLRSSEGYASGDAEAAGMSELEIEEQPRGA